MSVSNIVIKVGGDLAAKAEQCDALAADLLTLSRRGHAIVVVHGGGPQTTRVTEQLGLEPNIVGGRRITDRDTLDVVKMVLGGLVNVDLTARLTANGLPCVGLSGTSAHLIDAVKRPPRVVSGCGDLPIDFGFVGDIVGINVALLQSLHQTGFIPVMNSMGADREGQVFNINADVAATRVAAALGARLVLTTGGVRGVMRDKDDPETRIPSLTIAEARQAILDGVIQGGMIPKVEESLSVLGQGVQSVHILGRLSTGDLVAEIDAPGSTGTALLSERD